MRAQVFPHADCPEKINNSSHVLQSSLLHVNILQPWCCIGKVQFLMHPPLISCIFQKKNINFLYITGIICMASRHYRCTINPLTLLLVLSKQIPHGSLVILSPVAVHVVTVLVTEADKTREICPPSRRWDRAEDQSYLQQSASGGTSPHYWAV